LDYSVYIIKQNTPESRLLHHAGINRNDLEIANWKGKKKRYGGFGRSPVEWRICGINNVEKLCETIVRILGNRKELNNIEKHALNRAITTLKGISATKNEQIKLDELKETRKKMIQDIFGSRYPSISITLINEMAVSLAGDTFESFEALLLKAKNNFIEIILPIEEARKKFYELMRID
jgi:hypothetical protein